MTMRPPWITDRDPTEPGHYLTSMVIDIQDDGNVSRFVRLEHWDGRRWDTLGGYVRVEGWWWMPEPIQLPKETT